VADRERFGSLIIHELRQVTGLPEDAITGKLNGSVFATAVCCNRYKAARVR
jgi:hypothetical protein